jgi:hypothetical protein
VLGGNFTKIIEKVIDEAVNTSSPAEKIDQYLANELRNAFRAAFVGYLPTKTFSGSDAAGSNNGNDISQSKQEASTPATDANTVVGTVAVNLTTTINGFKVDVLTDKVAAAAALKNRHELAESTALKNIFRQSAWSSYINDASGLAVTYPDTNALTMKKGDTLTFVFDMDVNSAGAGAAAGPSVLDEDVPLSGSQVADGGYGKSEFSLELANRRVAFNIKLTNDASAKFEVGAAANQLRVQTQVSSAGVYPGAGTNPSSGSNTGSTQ